MADNNDNVILGNGITEQTGGLNPQDTSSGNAIYSDRVNNKTKLYKRLDEMDTNDRRMLLKIIQFDLLMEAMSAVENLKNTKESTWKKVIGKLNAIKDINIGVDPSGFDFKKLLTVLIPLLGLLAGILLALRQAEAAEKEASAPNPDNPDDPGNKEVKKLNEAAKAKAEKVKSIILQYCDGKSNGYSYTG
jgi:F0F1-type ATP synthase assembly protein I